VKSERLYSDRISPLAFFIEFPFAASHATCTENANGTGSVSMMDRDQTAKARLTESDEPVLAY